MKKYLHDSDGVFISPQQGWEQMQLLLDKKLPVHNNEPARKVYFTMLVAASLVIILLCCTLVLNNIALNKSFDIDVANAESTIPAGNKSTVKQRKLIDYTSNIKIDKPTRPSIIKSEQHTLSLLSSDLNKFTFTTAVPSGIGEQTGDEPIEILPQENVAVKSTMIVLPAESGDADSTELSLKVVNNQKKRRWNLSAGLAMNTMIGQQQNFTPYPAVVWRYNVSNKSFLSLGLAARSPVSTENRGVAKTVYVNDLVNNIQFYNAVNHYHNIAYADIPLLAGIKIGKTISLQAGLQASVLLKAKSKIFIEPYDFQMRLAPALSSGLLAGTAAPGSETNYKVEVRNIDFRVTSGIQYNINKLSFNLMYQYGLRPALKGDFISENKNQLVTFNVQFKIR